MFVREGFISGENPTRLYFTYVLTLKEKMEAEGGVKAVSFDEIVHLVWALMATEDELMHNPLIPRLLERLHEFKRPDTPLSKDELLELHQVNVLVQDQIKNGKWPKEFKEVVPRKVRDLCEEEYALFDKNAYQDVQIDIAKKLLKLRTTFQENTKVGKTFRVDFRLTDVDKLIVLKGADQVNPRTNEWLGLQGFKHKFLSRRLKGYDLVVIEVEQWKQMSEQDQYSFLYQLARSSQAVGHGHQQFAF